MAVVINPAVATSASSHSGDAASCHHDCLESGAFPTPPRRSGPGVGAFRREAQRHLIDAGVYTSEMPWTKPSPQAFTAAMEGVGETVRRDVSTSATGS